MMSAHSKSKLVYCPILADKPESGLFQDLTKHLYVNIQAYPGILLVFCKIATVADIEAQGLSLNPGRYVGVTERIDDEGDFRER